MENGTMKRWYQNPGTWIMGLFALAVIVFWEGISKRTIIHRIFFGVRERCGVRNVEARVA
jgi:hypothetical protein